MATGSSPLLDQYNRDGIVTPALQKALDMARQKMGEQFQLPGGAAPASPATPTLSAPGAFQVPTISRLAATPQPLVGTGAEPGGAAPTLTPPSAPAISQPRPAPSAAEHQQELTRLTTGATGKSGIEQIQNPWLRTPLRVLDALGSAFVPALTAALPGTQFHHQGLVNMARGNVNQDEAQATAEASRAHMGAETDELPARAEHERAQAEALAHPKAQLEWQQGSEPEVDPAHPEVGPQAVWYNKSDPTQKHFGGAPVAAKPVAEKNEPHYEKTDDGSIIALTKDKDGKPGYQVVYHGDPKVETEVADLEVGGKPHKVIVNKKTGETIKDLGESGIKPPTVNVNAETNRADHSYDKRNAELTAIGKPISDLNTRMGRLQDTLAQNSPQADALVAPELLTVMAGGSGSGLRMNEAEIARIVGGRSNWESLKAATQKWSLDPKAANSITADQRQQIRALITAVGSKLSQKQSALNEAYRGLAATDDVKEHRRIIDGVRESFSKIDTGGEGQGGEADPKLKAYANQYFGGDLTKAQAAIDRQRGKK